MSAAEITALCTGLPAVIGAVTALIIAIRTNRTTAGTRALLTQHVISSHIDHGAGQ